MEHVRRTRLMRVLNTVRARIDTMRRRINPLRTRVDSVRRFGSMICRALIDTMTHVWIHVTHVHVHPVRTWIHPLRVRIDSLIHPRIDSVHVGMYHVRIHLVLHLMRLHSMIHHGYVHAVGYRIHSLINPRILTRDSVLRLHLVLGSSLHLTVLLLKVFAHFDTVTGPWIDHVCRVLVP